MSYSSSVLEVARNSLKSTAAAPNLGERSRFSAAADRDDDQLDLNAFLSEISSLDI